MQLSNGAVTVPASIGQALEGRVRTDPARPLIVWHGPQEERVELSAVTFANWVDKTVNLVADLGREEAPRVGACLLTGRPGHWVSLVWAAATWSMGGALLLGGPCEMGSIDLGLVGPQRLRQVGGADTIACSLHPLGAAFTEPLPEGLIDYHEVLGQPDVHTPVGTVEGLAWCDPEQTLEHDHLITAAPRSGRLVVPATGTQAFTVVRDGLIAPLLGGGSSVLVEGDCSPERLQRIAQAEKAELA